MRFQNIFLACLFAASITHSQTLQDQLNNLTNQVVQTVLENVEPLQIEFEVTKVKYDVLKSPDKLTITMQFTGYNPNSIGVKLGRVDFDVYVDDKFATKLTNDEKIEIPAAGEFAFKEKGKIKLSTVGKTLFNRMRKKETTYRLDGTYYVHTPIGDFPFKAELLEKKTGP